MIGLIVSGLGLLFLAKAKPAAPIAPAATAAAAAILNAPANTAPTAVGNDTVKAALTSDINKLAGLVPVPQSVQGIYNSEVTKLGDWLWGNLAVGNSTVNGKI